MTHGFGLSQNSKLPGWSNTGALKSKELLSELTIYRQNMTGVALCNGVFITDQCKETSSQCTQTKLYAGLAKEVNLSTYQPLNLSLYHSQPRNLSLSLNPSACHSLTLSTAKPHNLSTSQPLSLSTILNIVILSSQGANLSLQMSSCEQDIISSCESFWSQENATALENCFGHYSLVYNGTRRCHIIPTF